VASNTKDIIFSGFPATTAFYEAEEGNVFLTSDRLVFLRKNDPFQDKFRSLVASYNKLNSLKLYQSIVDH
jgi:hypothetical protein